MPRTGLLSAAAALALIATPASAAIVFDLDNVKLVDGGTLVGSLTVSDDLSSILSYDITSSATTGSIYGNYVSVNYTEANSTVLQWTGATGLLAQISSPLSQLRIYFEAPLTENGAVLDQTAAEWQQLGGTRHVLSGSLIAQADEPSGIVPEPAAWALMIAGFGLVGASLRRRERLSVKLS